MALSPPVPGPPRSQPVRLPSRATGIDVTAFILAFLIPLIGAIIGMVAIADAHKQGRQASGLAVAAVVIGWVAVLIVVIVVIAVAVAHQSPDPTQQYINCMNNAIANGTPVQNCVAPAN